MLSVYTIEMSEKWDSIVRTFKNYDVYYLSGYVKAFQLHGDGVPLLFSYESDALRGINVVMKRDIAKDPHFIGKLPENTCFDFASPYGYGGWILEGEGDKTPLFAAYMDWCRGNGIISEFIRFSPLNDRIFPHYGELVPRAHDVVRDLGLPMEEIYMDFEHKVRKNVKKAETYGLKIQIDACGACMKDFLSIYYRTMDRNHAEGTFYFDEAFYKQINTMTGNYLYFNVLLDGKVISTELVLLGANVMHSYLGGTDNEYFPLRANDFLKYHIIRWGHEHNYRFFVLGGGYGADDGIFRYKKSFAPQGIIRFYTGHTIFDQEEYQNLLAQRVDLPENNFFPRYRA